MTRQTCNTCRFSRYTQEGGTMDCRRRAPAVVQWKPTEHAPVSELRKPRQRTLWPIISEDDWCGEWEAPRAGG